VRRGGCSPPPKFWATQIFSGSKRSQEKPVFQLFFEKQKYFLFLPEVGIVKPVKFTQDSGCLARDELLVISKS